MSEGAWVRGQSVRVEGALARESFEIEGHAIFYNLSRYRDTEIMKTYVHNITNKFMLQSSCMRFISISSCSHFIDRF